MSQQLAPPPSHDRVSRPEPIRLCHLPTPLEEAPAIERWLGGPRVLIKRDDCTGFALGGNKGRKLEYIFADALAAGADTVLTAAGVQSNHCRHTAAAAARLGLTARITLLDMVDRHDAEYRLNGNVLLDRLFGAEIDSCPAGLDPTLHLQRQAESLRAAGRNPYIIEFGGSNPLGAQGYVDCAREVATQMEGLNERLDHIVLATGSGGTQAGLIAGLRGLGIEAKVHGISVLRTDDAYADEVLQVAMGAAELANFQELPQAEDVKVWFSEVAPGYGQPNDQMMAALDFAARHAALVLDPVYTGKALAGLKTLVAHGEIEAAETVVFLHTGGAPGLFAYRSEFDARAESHHVASYPAAAK